MDYLRRKLTVRAHGLSLVLVKRPIESAEHVLQKALLWALYLPRYPNLRVEVPLPQPSRYKPDLLALDERQEPIFWGECGEVSIEKLRFLLSRYRRTHIVFSKWDTRLDPFGEFIIRALPENRRAAPVELISFPPEAADWIAPDGTIAIRSGDFELRRWEAQ
ncbi:MAG TPA: hypothetical protein VFZ66_21300 [Herpetosiphonaceae bacterium]